MLTKQDFKVQEIIEDLKIKGEKPQIPGVRRYSPSRNECNQILTSPVFASRIARDPLTVDSKKVDMAFSSSCEEIKLRGSYMDPPQTKIEIDFPIAFVRVVYRAYHVQELLFNLMYTPQNLFCYALDNKSSPLFHEHMRNLSACFPNVFLTETEYNVDSAGHNMTRSYLECLNILRKKSDWKYAILLQ
ncbi:unnamed protein product, partial [Gongylonema pulchrum]|uniref:Tyrosine-protein phosphatase domain-containing protein n=1 Tax=Gongylonema pulchrum TaxID=637853 RepID=A0A183DA69_9BILA